MKIAILSPIAWQTPPKHYGPWEQVASNVAEGLVDLGMEVTLFATGDSLTKGKLDSVIPVGYEEDRELDAKVVECLHISNVMEKAADFDIIHNHFDFLPLTYAKLINTPMVTTIHGFSSPKIVPVYQKYNDHTSYTSISNSDRHPDLNYLATVYNGIKTSDFTFQAKAEDYLLFLGRIHPHKGTAAAIEIAKRTKRKLIIAGIIQDQAYFKEKVEPFLDEDIQFIGPADAKKRNELLGKSLGLLHPILFDEPFGLVVAEAMMCGTPVIAFNRGAMPELISTGETGFLVDTVDEAVERVYQLHNINRNRCRKHAVANFSKEKMAESYLQCYQQILKH
ncbi:MAG: glycosyltransferase family 4 protein [Pedobacter sp.]|nr:glycosyltransferase family 4 protein [Pedobacter sp.]MDQ8053310.1 glycosyltransferase family 4 protein [Pedobacter sp.]